MTATTNGVQTAPPSPVTVIMSMLLVGTPMLPPFGLAALAPDIRNSFGISGQEIGFVVAAFFVTSALVSRRAGRIVERDRATVSLVVAAASITGAMFGLAFLADGVRALALWSALAGVGNAFAHVCVNLLVVRKVPTRRRALTFGLKQSAIPLAGLLAGLSVPAADVLGGWDRVFAAFGAMTLVVLVWAVREAREGARRRVPAPAPGVERSADTPLPTRGVLVLAALGAALGVGPMTVVASFVVVAGVAAGLAPRVGGITLAVGSLIAIALRVSFGWLVDHRVSRGRTTGAPQLMVGTLVVSAAGLVAIDGSVQVRFVLGAAVGLGVGWAWHGLLDYSVVRLYEVNPARATGISQIGAYVGGILGPLGGGILVDRVGADLVWTLSAVSVLGAAAAFAGSAVLAHRSKDLASM
jgi:predicted MFS family arabinose efflux permease